MIRLFQFASVLFLFIARPASAQTIDSLRNQVQKIVSTKKATVGVSIIGNDGKDTVSLNSEKHLPMQSVFKFHIALAVLAEIDKGKFSLDKKMKILKKDLLPNLYSPIRDKYPNGARLSVAELMSYTVSLSDNVGCDVLLKLIGGPKVVEDYFAKNNLKDVAIKFNEEQQQGNWDLQFQNWTTPRAANEILSAFYYNKPKLLSKKSYDFLWKTMKETKTGQARLKAQLPKGTLVAHKTGSSGTNKEGVTAAVNDIGIVFLPNGKPFFISVFVTNSTENDDANQKIIADIAKASWNYFNAIK